MAQDPRREAISAHLRYGWSVPGISCGAGGSQMESVSGGSCGSCPVDADGCGRGRRGGGEAGRRRAARRGGNKPVKGRGRREQKRAAARRGARACAVESTSATSRQSSPVCCHTCAWYVSAAAPAAESTLRS